ncbi:YSIRK-type signal peptide-containing protein [Streptococcus pseudopneumoniae]|uniref:YSIRK-type signal peptide-containing protein n=1 Tax=Streptococcus pseudopneumoniae TaxID=257758 RepID=UPI00202ED05B|nr:YSIRK-type signal peptide-containing protein [Streptococcus pseudopneumoniae]
MFYKGNEDREKRLRFSIRKVSFGAASVAVAALFMFPGNGTVSATEQGVTPTNEETQGSSLKDPDVQNGTYGATPVVSQLDGNSGTSEASAPKGQEETSTPTSTDASAPSVESPTVSKEQEETSTTASATEEKSAEKNTEVPSTEANSVENKEQARVKTEETSTTSAATTESKKTKSRKKRDISATPDADVATDDPSANQTYTAPSADASVEELVNALKTLPTTITNETELASIDEVGNLKGVQSGQVIDISEFGGWKAVEGGKFGLARKTEKGVFPIETANTVKVDRGPYRTYLDESLFDRSQEYILLLGKVRTEANKSEPVSDGSLYKPVDNGNNGNKGKGLASFKGIQKTFKTYSQKTGSSLTVSFRTGFTGDIDGFKAGYKVEVFTKDVDNKIEKIYEQSFKPTETKTDNTKILRGVNANGNQWFETGRTPTPTREKLNESLGADSNKRRLGANYGSFTSKGIELAPNVTEYTVRISAADSNKLGMSYQVPWQHYALPVTGREFNITQDTKQVAKALLKQAYDKLLADQQKDEHRKTEDSVRTYQEKLAKIKELLDSNELKNNSEYLSVLESAVDSRDDLKAQTPSQPTVTADEPTASVSVKPVGEADKVEIGLTTDGGAKKLTASKGQDGTWSLDETPAGVSINAQTGEVTVSHTAVVAGSNVTAKSKQGNSDLSGESSVAIPAKTATPSQPTVTADEPTASVSVKPVGEADKVEIGLTTDGGAKKLTASKGQDGTWSLDETPAGVSINAQTGEVTVSHTAVVAGSNVTAKSKQGNSDLSGTGSAQMPIYRPTPLPRPIPVPDNGNTNSLVPSDLDGNQPGNAGDVNTTEPASPSVPTSPSDSGQANSGQDGRSTDSGSTTTARSSVAPVTTTEPTVNTANREDDTVRSATQGQGTLDKSELSKQTQTLENLLRALTGVSNPTTDSARLVLAEAKKALADDSLTEQGLRHILQTVKDAIASLESIKESQSATKAGEQKVSESAPEADKPVVQTQVPVGIIAASILVLLGLLFFLLARRNKESELEKLAKELSKLLKDSNLETVDKDVLENSQEELQKAVSFLADEKGSEHTEAELIDNLKKVIAKLKANA